VLQLRCTKKVLDLFTYGKENLADIEESSSPLGNWYVNLLTIDRKKTLLFMSETTLLSFVLFGVKKATAKNIEEKAVRGIVALLESEDFAPAQIERVIDDYLIVCVTKTSGRKSLGNMNDLAFMYKHLIERSGGFAGCDLYVIQQQVNRTPQRNLDWQYSIDVARAAVTVGESPEA